MRARAGKCQSGEGSAWWGPGPSLRGYASKRGHWERGERKFFVHVQIQTCKKIMIFDLKDQDHLIDLDLLPDLDQFNDLLN